MNNKRFDTIKLLQDTPYEGLSGEAGEAQTVADLSWPSLTEFAKTISDCVIPSLNNHSPLLISGDWGAGKTSLLRYVEAKMLKKSSKIQAVWFDAWLYENETNLLQALIRVIWQQYQDKNLDIKASKKELCYKALHIAGVLGIRWLSQRAGLGATGLKNIQDDIGTIENIPLENSIDQLVATFNALLLSLWDEQEVIFFIDDLDRCSPESAVALLESIRSLLNATVNQSTSVKIKKANFKFVIIMDKSTLADAVRTKYAALNSYDANRYLEKMFPQSFSVPQPKAAEVAELIHQQIDELNQANSPKIVVPANVAHIFIATLSKPEYANPRLIKRCLNRFAFFHYISTANSLETDDNLSPEDLILWLAAIERWPLLRRLLSRKADAFWLEFYQQLKKGDEIGEPDGKALATQPGIREFFAAFDKDNVLLRMKQFVKIDQGLNQYGL